MSGGSYNYLHQAASDPGTLAAQVHDLERMRERLDQLAAKEVPGAAYGAYMTRVTLALLNRAVHTARRITEVWHAVEWRDSGDWDEEQLRQALAEYEGARRGSRNRG